jgi:uncharacterized membrane protein YfcA
MLFILIIFVLGLIAAMVGSLIGLGGGVFVVPALLLLRDQFSQLHHITPQIAVGTSLIMVIFTAAGSTYSYAKQKKVDFKSGLFFFLASGPGAIVGAHLNQGISENVFHLSFGFILIIILFFLIKNKKMAPKNIRWHVTRQTLDDRGELYEYGYHRYLALLICFLVGVIQGLLGIGAGALLVPAMILLFWFPTHVAIATTMFVILLSSMAGSISHILLGNIDWRLLLLLAPGALLGGQVGATISSKINTLRLTYFLRGVILFLAIYALWQGIGAFL